MYFRLLLSFEWYKKKAWTISRLRFGRYRQTPIASYPSKKPTPINVSINFYF